MTKDSCNLARLRWRQGSWGRRPLRQGLVWWES
jgi:hypothetical protein